MTTMTLERKENKTNLAKTGESAPAATQPKVTPAYRIHPSDDAYALELQMPGVEKPGLDLRLDGDMLSIRGAMSAPEWDGFELAHGEFPYVEYESSFRLSDEIDREKIKANFENGVLKVSLPKSVEVLPKKIDIAVG
jgi:HSP20 family molecular chaperone IbpA